MINPVGRYEFTVDAYLADFRGKATLPMIASYILQAASKNAEEHGFGYSEMTRDKKVWVLSRMVIEMVEYPKNDTVLVLKTWIADVNKLFTERCFSFQDQEGNILGYTKSIWALIDLSTRRPTNLLAFDNLLRKVTKDKECPIEGLKKIPLIKDLGATSVGSFEVKYSDIDINKHLNSMKYIEHFVDVFGIEKFKEKEIQRFQINYVTEVHYGTKIEFIQKEEVQDSVYILEMRDKDATVCTSRITWK